MLKRPSDEEVKDSARWHREITQFFHLGFSSKEIHAILVDRGLSEDDATLLIRDIEKSRVVSPEQVEAARANAGCMISLFILAVAFVVFLIKARYLI